MHLAQLPHRTRPSADTPALACLLLVFGFAACAAVLAAPPGPPAKSDARAAAPIKDEGRWSVVLNPGNTLEPWVTRNGKPMLSLSVCSFWNSGGWGGEASSQTPAVDGLFDISLPWRVGPEPRGSPPGQPARRPDYLTVLHCRTVQTDGPTFSFRYDLNVETNAHVKMIKLGLFEMPGMYGPAVFALADGKAVTNAMPYDGDLVVPDVTRITIQPKGIGEVAAAFDHPCTVHLRKNEFLVVMAETVLKAPGTSLGLTLTLPASAAFESSARDIARYRVNVAQPDWFAFETQDVTAPGLIGFNDWLDKPAGRHGGVRLAGDRFEFEDKTPVKFWGANLCWGRDCAPDPAAGAVTAQRFAKYGVNCVRLHKFTYPNGMGIGNPKDSLHMLPDGLDRFDRFTDALARQGVYFGWSHTWTFTVTPNLKNRVRHYDEIKAYSGGGTYGLINFADDVQDLLIEMVVNLLKHKNPYTGTTYAENPALAYIEIQNEDDIFWYTTANVLAKCPLYRQDLMGRYAAFLRGKYGSQDGLAKVWGKALEPQETLEAATVSLQGNPWFMSSDGLAKVADDPGACQRLLDNAEFFHGVQNDYYAKFVKAVRDAGYQGPLCGSPWQAPPDVPHYYNLRSDALVGWIDRHGYCHGNRDAGTSMINRPGSGLLNFGLQQVADRPFGLSEWFYNGSTEQAQGAAIMAVYALGLQGWDASYQFTSTVHSESLSNPWAGPGDDVDSPCELGQFPALARMIARGDVKEGEVISRRFLSLENLRTARFDFTDRLIDLGATGEHGPSLPAAAMGAGRNVLEFVPTPQPSIMPDMSKYERDRIVTSNTGQLRWDYNGQGFFTVDTAGTKAVVGFAADKPQTLGNVRVTTHTPFASLFLTARERNADLSNASSALIMAVASQAFRGATRFSLNGETINPGQWPIMLEPVVADIAVTDRAIDKVLVLDLDGRSTDRTVEVKDGAFTINTGRDKTLYYQVVFR